MVKTISVMKILNVSLKISCNICEMAMPPFSMAWGGGGRKIHMPAKVTDYLAEMVEQFQIQLMLYNAHSANVLSGACQRWRRW